VASIIREGFPRRHRIVHGAQFRAVYDAGAKLHSDKFVLFSRANTLDHHRLGITVSRKVGGAVIRNHVKRLFREIFRKSFAEIPGHFDLVVNARRSCAEARYAELREEFVAAARKICG
jgi:ribonuclease P protein component